MSSSSASSDDSESGCEYAALTPSWKYRFECFFWDYYDELRRLRRSFVAKFDLAIREHVYQFVDKDTADAMVVLEIQF